MMTSSGTSGRIHGSVLVMVGGERDVAVAQLARERNALEGVAAPVEVLELAADLEGGLACAGVALALVELREDLRQRDDRPALVVGPPVLEEWAVEQGARVGDEQALAVALGRRE